MAILKAPSMNDTLYQGPGGNLSLAEGYIELNKASSGDIELLELPIGIRIYAVNLTNTSLGFGVWVEIKCGQTTLVGKTLHSSKITRSEVITPYTTKEAGEKLLAHISCDSTSYKASGKLTVCILYVVVGY
ncbi:hypothetical protein ABQG65_08815 [Yersinia alsatica]|uniref:hypothetical protein n=1 Tax=Yersinia alsatica TaxID=2890317 RepID=UPI0032EFC3DD